MAQRQASKTITPEAIRAAILLGTTIPIGIYDLGENCKLCVWADGYRQWFRFGVLHREDGPAVEYPNGLKSWFREGKHVKP